MLTTHQPADALIEVLRREHVAYELIPHHHTETALAEASALGVDPHQVAKTLILTTPFGFVRAVIAASDRLDLEKARFTLNTAEVELVTEETLVGAYPEFELGAVPPWAAPSTASSLTGACSRARSSFSTQAPTTKSVRLRTGDLLSIAEAEVADLALE